MGISRRWRIAAYAWGFAEATLFFTVPDVLLTFAVVKIGWRKALRLLVLVLTGALIGGAAMYGLASINTETARATVDSVPLISREMIERGAQEMRGDWLREMIVGAMTGTPYKVYAIEAPGAGIPLSTFLLGSFFARSVRWLLTLAFAALVVAGLRRAGLAWIAVPLWAVMWIAFYIFYYIVAS